MIIIGSTHTVLRYHMRMNDENICMIGIFTENTIALQLYNKCTHAEGITEGITGIIKDTQSQRIGHLYMHALGHTTPIFYVSTSFTCNDTQKIHGKYKKSECDEKGMRCKSGTECGGCRCRMEPSREFTSMTHAWDRDTYAGHTYRNGRKESSVNVYRGNEE